MGALCILEEKIAGNISIQDEVQKRITSGVLSGIAGALCSYPLSLFKDYVQVQSTVKDGKLYNKGALAAAQELYDTFKGEPLSSSFMKFIKISKIQLPIRVVMTGYVFGMIGGIMATLGNEPLRSVVPEKFQPPTPAVSSVGFFAQARRITPAALEGKPATEAAPTRVELR